MGGRRGPAVEGVGANAPGATLAKWGEGGDEAASLLERHAVCGRAAHGVGNQRRGQCSLFSFPGWPMDWVCNWMGKLRAQSKHPSLVPMWGHRAAPAGEHRWRVSGVPPKIGWHKEGPGRSEGEQEVFLGRPSGKGRGWDAAQGLAPGPCSPNTGRMIFSDLQN